MTSCSGLCLRFRRVTLAAALALLPLATGAADPIKVGCSVGLTGPIGPGGKQILAAFELSRDDVNAKGGLLGRPIQLIYYDDQSTPANVPAIYTKLMDLDKVDLLLGPYGTNWVAAAIPLLMQRNRLTIGITANAANSKFHYDKYFSMLPTGPRPKLAFSDGFFDIAMGQTPKPQTVAIVGADAEFSQNAIEGARENAKAAGLRIVYDQTYPPNATDFTPIVRAIDAAHSDLVYAAAYPLDSVGLVRAVHEVGLNAKMFGGTMIGLLYTSVKMQLGPLLNGIINQEIFLPAKTLQFPGLAAVLSKYQRVAESQDIDRLGYGFVPFAYAAGQVLAQAVAATESLDQAQLAAYMHRHTFRTVVGDITFGNDGERTQERVFFAQFQGVAGHDVGQFRAMSHEPVLWPSAYKTGTLIYPYDFGRK